MISTDRFVAALDPVRNIPRSRMSVEIGKSKFARKTVRSSANTVRILTELVQISSQTVPRKRGW
jgi:hypothetical protein